LRRCGFEVVLLKNTPFYFWGISLHCIIVVRRSPEGPSG
jgi:hypothetical protein